MENTSQRTNAHDAHAPLDVLILAAGLGTRMRSRTAKVLHKLGGLPLIVHVCRAAAALSPRHIYVVVGHQAEEVEATVRRELGDEVRFVLQKEQRGTGDAVMAARAELENADATLLILSGDVPLIRPETLGALIHQHRTHRGRGAACTLLSVRLDDPTGYGRIVRDEEGRFVRIIEQRDASPEERQIKEVNAGIYCFETRQLFRALEKVQPTNAQGEYYLTDVPSILRAEGEDVSVYVHADAREVAGINTRAELAEFERLLRMRTLRRLMLEGVTIIDPVNTYIGPDVQIARDTIIYPNVHIEGRTTIGEGCTIYPGARIADSLIGNEVTIKDHSIIIEAEIEDGCSIGPFAHLRMGARLAAGAAVGNFVEVKKSRLGRKTKAMHLAYLGDATIGERTNIGAGTITCNYDGVRKHETIIEDEVKIGSDTMLVAPVRVGARAVTGAGSVVIRDVPPDTLVAGVPATVKKHLRSEEEAPAAQSSSERDAVGRDA